MNTLGLEHPSFCVDGVQLDSPADARIVDFNEPVREIRKSPDNLPLIRTARSHRTGIRIRQFRK